jgi:hypothetical protein
MRLQATGSLPFKVVLKTISHYIQRKFARPPQDKV